MAFETSQLALRTGMVRQSTSTSPLLLGWDDSPTGQKLLDLQLNSGPSELLLGRLFVLYSVLECAGWCHTLGSRRLLRIIKQTANETKTKPVR